MKNELGMNYRVFHAKFLFAFNGGLKIWAGPSPIDFLKDKAVEAFVGHWYVPLASDGLWTVKAVKTKCMEDIRKGEPIGLVLVQTPFTVAHGKEQ